MSDRDDNPQDKRGNPPQQNPGKDSKPEQGNAQRPQTQGTPGSQGSPSSPGSQRGPGSQGGHGTSPGRGPSTSSERRPAQQPGVTDRERGGDSSKRRDDERNPSAPSKGEAEVERQGG